MDKLNQLYKKLLKDEKRPLVVDAIAKLLTDPTNTGLQIDVLGNAHISNWLPNQKKVLWESLNKFNTNEWIQNSISRLIEDKGDELALFSLLKCSVYSVLLVVKEYNHKDILIWDVQGATSYGVGLANNQNDGYYDYIYVGWDSKKNDLLVSRIDYIESIRPSSKVDSLRIDHLNEKCQINNWIWGELPYGYGNNQSFTKSFYQDSIYKTSDSVKKLLTDLGLSL